jgi:hypothetical protein
MRWVASRLRGTAGNGSALPAKKLAYIFASLAVPVIANWRTDRKRAAKMAALLWKSPRSSATLALLVASTAVVSRAVSGRLGIFGFLAISDRATDEFSVERKRLQHDVEAVAVLVREYEADVEPEVVLALAPDHRIGAVRRLSGLFLIRHGTLLRVGCDVLRGQAPRIAWRLPARLAARRMTGTIDSLRGEACLSNYRFDSAHLTKSS